MTKKPKIKAVARSADRQRALKPQPTKPRKTVIKATISPAIQRALEAFPGTRPEDWTACGFAAYHRDASVEEPSRNLGGRAIVRDAEVFGDARVYGDAQVSGDARVYGNAEVYGGFLRSVLFQLSGVLPWPVNASAPDELRIGCQRHTMGEWRSRLDAICRKHGVSDSIKARVVAVLDLADLCPEAFPQQLECAAIAKATGGDDA